MSERSCATARGIYSTTTSRRPLELWGVLHHPTPSSTYPLFCFLAEGLLSSKSLSPSASPPASPSSLWLLPTVLRLPRSAFLALAGVALLAEVLALAPLALLAEGVSFFFPLAPAFPPFFWWLSAPSGVSSSSSSSSSSSAADGVVWALPRRA